MKPPPGSRSRSPLSSSLLASIATTASAKFTSHNGADVTQTDVVQGSEFNTCGDHISGLIGWGTTLTLEQLGGTLPPEATGPANYEVFRFPPGANPQDYQAVFDVNTGEVLRYELVDGGGNVVDTAPKISTFSSGNRTVIAGGPIEQPFEFDPTVTEYIYTQVSFSQRSRPRLPSAPRSRSSPPAAPRFAHLTVVACTDATHRRRRLDRRAARTVGEQGQGLLGLPTLVILVKGSAYARRDDDRDRVGRDRRSR